MTTRRWLSMSAAADAQKQNVRHQIRLQQGMAVPSASQRRGSQRLDRHRRRSHRRRPASATEAVGATDSEFSLQLKRGAAVAGRPRSVASGEQLVPSRSKASVGDANVAAVTGFIPTDRDFAIRQHLSRGLGAAICSAAAAALPAELALSRRVLSTLDNLKTSYFPASQSWSVRAAGGEGGVGRGSQAVARRSAKGSFVVFQGQPPALKRRQANQLKQMTELQRTCTGLDESQLLRIRHQFVASSKDPNPVVSFPKFLEVMKGVGVGGRRAEYEFFQRWAMILLLCCYAPALTTTARRLPLQLLKTARCSAGPSQAVPGLRHGQQRRLRVQRTL